MKKSLAFLVGVALLGSPLAAADKPLVMEAGQIKQLPAATSLQLQAPTTANATINLPHGTAPTSPSNGDCWTTTAGLFCRINGSTVGPYGSGTLTLTGDVTGSGAGSVATTLATVNSNVGTFGSATQSLTATVNAKGLITAISTQTVTPSFSSITSKPTTLAGYGITDAQGLNGNLTAIAGLTTAADKMLYWTGSGTAALISVPSAARTALTSLSGTNTGDQTSVSGNAGTATQLATGRTIAMTGDVTWTSPTFDGTGNVTAAATVVRINGVALSGLATGILKNTTGTGVPSIAVAGDFPTLNQSTTGSAASLTTPRTISITGKATAAGGTFDGTGNLALNVTAVTLLAGDIPNIAESQVTNLTTDLAAKAPLASPSFTGQVSVTGSGNDLVSVVGSGTGRSGFYAKASNSAGNATFYFENDRGGFASYGGVVTGGSTNANSFFGLTRADKTFLIHDGASGLGMGIGTLTNTPVVFGVNNAEVARLTSTGFSVTGASNSTGDQLITGTGAQGYGTGSGGTVTQLTSKATGVTLSKTNGRIITINTALAAAGLVSFTVTNTTVAATDTIILNLASGNTTAGTYRYWIDKVSAGSFVIAIENRSAGSLSEALTFNFAVIKAVTS